MTKIRLIPLLFLVTLQSYIIDAFVLQQSPTRSLSSALHVATTPPPKGGKGGFKWDDWSDKPIEKASSTKPLANEKAKNFIQRQMMDDVVIEPNYFLTYGTALVGLLIMWYHPSYTTDGTPSLIGIFGGCFHLLFATLLGVQTARVRCVFEKDAFEFYNIVGPKLDLNHPDTKLVKKPDNYVAGTENRWKYDDIIHYGFFPSLEYPVICYFKETATPEYKWNRWFAAFDSYGRGQPHFFPGICDVRKFKEQMELRGAKRKPLPTPSGKDIL